MSTPNSPHPARLTAGIAAMSFLLGLVVPVAVLAAWMVGTHALGASASIIFLGIPAFAIASAALLRWYLFRRRGLTWHDLGFVAPRHNLWHLLWAAPALILGSVTVAATTGNALHLTAPGASNGTSTSLANLGVATSILVATCTSIVVPFLEEVIFRGALFGWLQLRTNTVLAVLTTATIFGLSHLSPTVMLYVVPLGLGLTGARAWFGSTWASFALHAINNSLATVIAAGAMLTQ